MAVNVVQTALSSRRFNRWLMVIGAAVLVAGVIAILVTQFGNTAKKENTAPTGPAIAAPKPQPSIPFPEAAWKVAREFVFTAVARKHLVESYGLTHPSLRGGFTLKQWKTGTIPVAYFPAVKVIKYNWKNTNYAHPRDAALNLILVPSKSSGMRAGAFQIGLIKIGGGVRAHWVVNYFGAVQGPPVPTHSG